MTGPGNNLDLADLNDAAGTLVPQSPAGIGSTYSRTSWGNAQRLALYEGANLRYVNNLGEWYRWCGERWCRATETDMIAAGSAAAHRIAEEVTYIDNDNERGQHARWAEASLSEHALKAFSTVGAALPDLQTPITTFDQHVELFNVPNCTLNLRTLEWAQHERRQFITQLCPTPWVPTARSKLFDAFLERFIPDEKEREYTLQVLACASLAHGNPARQLIILLGPTSTGKSTLMELVKVTLGSDYVATVNPSVFRGNLDDKPRPDLLRALQSRLVLAFEASERWDLHVDQVKRMTGGDPITARSMRSNVMQEVVAGFVPIIVANTVPQMPGADDALRRRLLALIMDTPVAEDDDDGRKRQALIGDEVARQALLATLIQTYHECGGRVTLPMPPRYAEQTMEMFSALDDVDAILQQLKDEGSLIQLAPDASMRQCATFTAIYKCYAHWTKMHGTMQQRREMISIRQFGKRLRSLGYEIQRSDGMRVVGWCLGDTSTTNVARF